MYLFESLILLWLPDNKPNIQENTKKRVRKGRGRGGRGGREETEGTERFYQHQSKEALAFLLSPLLPECGRV
jgi:hypothetical protein